MYNQIKIENKKLILKKIQKLLENINQNKSTEKKLYKLYRKADLARSINSMARQLV